MPEVDIPTIGGYDVIVMSQEPTIGEVNKAVEQLSEKVDSVLDAIGEFSTKVDEHFERIESEISGVKSDIVGMKSDIVGIKNRMVTKEYLDDKLINLKADLTVVMRKEDHKLEALTKLLAAKKVISDDDAKGILSLEPFPQNI
jgi:archaellum component FlaC